MSSQQQAAHCDQPGYPSCYSLGYQAGKNHLGTSCPGGHSAKYCVGWNSGAGNTTHCDQPAWLSCYTLGYQAGTAALGASCPTGHSQAFCNGYEYGSGGNGRAYVQGVTDPTHCGQPGFPACYDVGNHDGYNNAVNEHHQFNNSCPLGHSKTFCNGYVPGYNLGVSYNLGDSRGRAATIRIMIGSEVITIYIHLTTIAQAHIRRISVMDILTGMVTKCMIYSGSPLPLPAIIKRHSHTP